MKPGKLVAPPPEMKLYDNEFVAFARLAAKAFRGIAGSLRKEASQGSTKWLVTRLRSGFGLGPEECEVLADLISGELCRPIGRPSKNASDRQLRRDVYDSFHQKMKQHRSEGRYRNIKALVIEQVASEFPTISTEQIEAMSRDKRMRS